MRIHRLRHPPRPDPKGQGFGPSGPSRATSAPSITTQESTPVRKAPVSTAMRFGWCSTAFAMVWPWTTLKPKSSDEVRRGGEGLNGRRACWQGR